MDDPAWSWPAWKFGMKREELFTKLHDQYNTFPSSIQDPEAFHHDVYEISNAASTSNEFHRLLADRREQRLRELNDGLESASLEIIANPKLIGTQQWQHALQLFRSKSLDSLVQYFASYLPDDHPWHHSFEQPSSRSDTISSTTGSDDSQTTDDSTTSSKPFFDDIDGELFTHEPFAICGSLPESHLPPSPRSLTMCSDSPAVSTEGIDHHDDYVFNTLTPARTLSFSEPESDMMVHSGMLSIPDHDEDETSQSDDPDTPITSVSDLSEVRSLPDSCPRHESQDDSITPAECEESVEEGEETPTPRNEGSSESYITIREHTKASSSTTKTPNQAPSPLYTHVLHEYVRSSRKSRRDCSPGWSTRRRSPELGRVQKPLSEPTRVRLNGRRRID